MDSNNEPSETQLPTRRRREHLTAVACSPCRHSKLKVRYLRRPGCWCARKRRLTRLFSAMDLNLYAGPVADAQRTVSTM